MSRTLPVESKASSWPVVHESGHPQLNALAKLLRGGQYEKGRNWQYNDWMGEEWNEKMEKMVEAACREVENWRGIWDEVATGNLESANENSKAVTGLRYAMLLGTIAEALQDMSGHGNKLRGLTNQDDTDWKPSVIDTRAATRTTSTRLGKVDAIKATFEFWPQFILEPYLCHRAGIAPVAPDEPGGEVRPGKAICIAARRRVGFAGWDNVAGNLIFVAACLRSLLESNWDGASAPMFPPEFDGLKTAQSKASYFYRALAWFCVSPVVIFSKLALWATGTSWTDIQAIQLLNKPVLLRAIEGLVWDLVWDIAWADEDTDFDKQANEAVETIFGLWDSMHHRWTHVLWEPVEENNEEADKPIDAPGDVRDLPAIDNRGTAAQPAILHMVTRFRQKLQASQAAGEQPPAQPDLSKTSTPRKRKRKTGAGAATKSAATKSDRKGKAKELKSKEFIEDSDESDSEEGQDSEKEGEQDDNDEDDGEPDYKAAEEGAGWEGVDFPEDVLSLAETQPAAHMLLKVGVKQLKEWLLPRAEPEEGDGVDILTDGVHQQQMRGMEDGLEELRVADSRAGPSRRPKKKTKFEGWILNADGVDIKMCDVDKDAEVWKESIKAHFKNAKWVPTVPGESPDPNGWPAQPFLPPNCPIAVLTKHHLDTLSLAELQTIGTKRVVRVIKGWEGESDPVAWNLVDIANHYPLDKKLPAQVPGPPEFEAGVTSLAPNHEEWITVREVHNRSKEPYAKGTCHNFLDFEELSSLLEHKRWRAAYASHSYAWKKTAAEVSSIPKPTKGIYEWWRMLATAGSWTPPHQDADGRGTVVIPLYGLKIWGFFTDVDGQLLREKFNPFQPLTDKIFWIFYLEQLDILIQGPNVHHGALTVEHSETIGSHHYCCTQLVDSWKANVKESGHGTYLTNASHPYAFTWLDRIAIFTLRVVQASPEMQSISYEGWRSGPTKPAVMCSGDNLHLPYPLDNLAALILILKNQNRLQLEGPNKTERRARQKAMEDEAYRKQRRAGWLAADKLADLVWGGDDMLMEWCARNLGEELKMVFDASRAQKRLREVWRSEEKKRGSMAGDEPMAEE